MKSEGAIELTDILRYDVKKGCRVKLKNCEIQSNFLFSKMDFYLVKKDKTYFICIPSDGELVLLTKEPDNGRTAGEVISDFRKNYLKNRITKEMIEQFIADPMKYSATYNKTAGQK